MLRAATFIEPCLPAPADKPPSGSNWIHEIKHDGYRLMARRDHPYQRRKTLMETAEQLEGRLAAIDLVCSLALNKAGRQHYLSAWPDEIAAELQKAVAEMRNSISGDAAAAAEEALGRMFNRSSTWT